jgi:transketolase
LTVERFGASAPWKAMATEFGFTAENILRISKSLL